MYARHALDIEFALGQGPSRRAHRVAQRRIGRQPGDCVRQRAGVAHRHKQASLARFDRIGSQARRS